MAKRDLAAVRAKVRDVQSVKPEVYKQQRNPIPEASRELKALGRDALVPMLEALAFDASQPGLSADEKEALVIGMISAVGEIRDARSTPVLAAILDAQPGSTPAALAAARALGKACGSSERQILISKVDGEKLRAAAVQGLGECRTLDSAKAIAKVAKSSADGETRKSAVRALGVVGSSWAWAAEGKADDDEALEVRTLASNTLIDIFVADVNLRTDSKRAVLKCEAPNALERVRAAKARADATTAKALESLERLIAQSAARKK